MDVRLVCCWVAVLVGGRGPETLSVARAGVEGLLGGDAQRTNSMTTPVSTRGNFFGGVQIRKGQNVRKSSFQARAASSLGGRGFVRSSLDSEWGRKAGASTL